MKRNRFSADHATVVVSISFVAACCFPWLDYGKIGDPFMDRIGGFAPLLIVELSSFLLHLYLLLYDGGAIKTVLAGLTHFAVGCMPLCLILHFLISNASDTDKFAALPGVMPAAWCGAVFSLILTGIFTYRLCTVKKGV